MFYRPWQTVRPDPARSAALSAALGMPRLVCDVMCARGLDTPEAARAVCGGGDALSDPMLLSGMEAAVARIHRAIDDGERIAVFGDYDVDGVTATALLYTYLDSAGADVYYKLPSRDDDGYGLSETAVDLMAAKGVSLIVTVDNGVSANAAIAHAKEQGVDVVVTDHHLPPQTLPEAAAIVNPQLPGDESPCKTLSGAGVAFKLAAALDGCTPDEMLPFYGDLAAIGTIADIMLLEGENRRIVKAGLALLQQTERPGIAALIEACGLGGKELTAENVSFGLAPRLNAAGRMDSAAAALELLLCEDPEEAEAIVAGLEAQNAARQKAEQDILQGVLDSVAADETYGADRILVVWGRGYHQGLSASWPPAWWSASASRPSSYPLTRTARARGPAAASRAFRCTMPSPPAETCSSGSADTRWPPGCLCGRKTCPRSARRSTRGPRRSTRCSSARRCGWTRRWRCPA